MFMVAYAVEIERCESCTYLHMDSRTCSSCGNRSLSTLYCPFSPHLEIDGLQLYVGWKTAHVLKSKIGCNCCNCLIDLLMMWWNGRVDEQSNDLAAAWDGDQRVKALKIAIQVCKGGRT